MPTLSVKSITVAREVQTILQKYKDLQDIIAILGMEELSDEDKVDRFRAEKCSAFFPSRSMWRKHLQACRCFVKIADTIRGFQGNL
jgi:F-type H+/Na+-transporting ATPase subunit beta